jgi:hypothetical protein
MRLFLLLLLMPMPALAGEALAPSALPVPLAPNEMPIWVGGADREPNVPFVSVTVCVPGTSECQTIDHIVLDSGSSGLRLFSSVVSLNLAVEKASLAGVQAPVAECMLFGGGNSFWGPVVIADVVLGGETAPRVPIQLWDNAYGSKPGDCFAPITEPSGFGTNGVLGISPAQMDCSRESCSDLGGSTYYTCDVFGSCSPAQLPRAKHIPNPVSLLKNDNNGVVVSFPALPAGADVSASGTLFLGIGTHANNRVKKGTHVLHSTYDGEFKALIEDQIYMARLDTGTPSWNMPSGLDVPGCRGVEASNHYLCPDSSVTFAATVQGIDHVGGTSFSFQIGNAEQQYTLGHFAADDYGQSWGGLLSSNMLFGMPFFYGKTVYFGIAGRSTPVGRGPFEAF